MNRFCGMISTTAIGAVCLGPASLAYTQQQGTTLAILEATFSESQAKLVNGAELAIERG